MKQTTITRQSCGVLRTELDEAISKVLTAHGLVGSLGRMHFLPGHSFHVKLEVLQPAEGVPVATQAEPKVGEVWLWGGREYTVEKAGAGELIASRPPRGSSFPRSYRIPEKLAVTGRRIR